ncbi:MAG: mannose-1-phosphate guanylyltransferase/mannose-6-phosphate isomerase [Bdellovibrionaceae bacterium]|nr:mannose-1-phosphate guanylyltransferase/mannose-6-phosphate isomerase [Pseudobdellovibrionaceae bacterium]
MIPVVISGGSGSRLWPISRTSYPKQFCEVFDEPLLERTLKRVRELGEPRVVTIESLRVLTNRCVQSLSIPSENVIYEPLAKNTAAAIALLCHRLFLDKKSDEIVGIFPADHFIQDTKTFYSVVHLAEKCARDNKIVTLGIEPTYPATGFGYVECEDAIFQTSGNLSARDVKAFYEKPDLTTAENFTKSGRHFWNAGMFVFQVSTMIEAFKTHLPDLWTKISTLTPDLSNLLEVYTQLPSISIDKGIMEKMKEQVCIPSQIGWSDLGSWDDYAKMAEVGFVSTANNLAAVVGYEAQHNFVLSVRPKTVALVNVDDVLVIDTPDALLIGKRGKSQNTKKIVEKLEENKNKTAREHTFDYRPWGKYDILSDDSEFKIKVIAVNPGQQLSYQSHIHRSEHWVVIEGHGEVVINEQVLDISPGSSIVIPMNSKHRIRNTGQKILRFVEVQTGEYFGEDDITRYEDDYKRV